jgi:membrane-anchored mycosin MYCP
VTDATATRIRGKAAAALATAVLLACTGMIGSGTSAAGQQERPRPPGVPPPVDMARLPSPQAAAAQIPFDNSVPGLRQIQGPTLGTTRRCVIAGDLPQLTVEPSPWGQRRLRFPDLRKFATGAGQVVAVIDTGVTAHSRLAGRLRDGGDYVQGRNALDDCDGHGTLVAGIIAAADDPSTGFTGIAPDAQILSIRQSTRVLEVRYFDERQGHDVQATEVGNTTSLALAVVHAVAQGATVINISEAACFPAAVNQVNPPDLQLQAAVHYAADQNVVVVAAAGNADRTSRCNPPNEPGRTVQTVASPAWFDDDVLAVGAIREDGEPAAFTLSGPWVDVAAPGTEVVSLDPVRDSNRLTNFTVTAQGQVPIQGTSFATPYVAGLAALVRQRFPDLTARQVMERIKRTAMQAPGRDGHQDTLGHGMIDPVAALTDVLPAEYGDAPPPAQAGPLDGLMPQPRKDPLPTTVALAGTGAGLAALAVTGFVVYTVNRARRRAERRQGTP